jgi:hypothetical protein
MGYTITDAGDRISFVHTEGFSFTLLKASIIKVDNQPIDATTVTDETDAQGLVGYDDNSYCVLRLSDGQDIKLQYTQVDSPVLADNDELYDALEALADEGNTITAEDVTLEQGDWVLNGGTGLYEQTLAVTGTTTETVNLFSMDRTNGDLWADNEVYAEAVTVADTIDFTAVTQPADDIDFTVVIITE